VGTSSFACYALTIGRIPCCAIKADINALSSFVEVLISLACLKINALPLLQPVVTHTLSTESDAISFKTVIRNYIAFVIHAPIASTAGSSINAVPSIIEIVTYITFITISSNKVERTTGNFSPNTRAKAQVLSLLTSSERRTLLKACSIANCIS
jgi:hypothetical protein